MLYDPSKNPQPATRNFRNSAFFKTMRNEWSGINLSCFNKAKHQSKLSFFDICVCNHEFLIHFLDHSNKI